MAKNSFQTIETNEYVTSLKKKACFTINEMLKSMYDMTNVSFNLKTYEVRKRKGELSLGEDDLIVDASNLLRQQGMLKKILGRIVGIAAAGVGLLAGCAAELMDADLLEDLEEYPEDTGLVNENDIYEDWKNVYEEVEAEEYKGDISELLSMGDKNHQKKTSTGQDFSNSGDTSLAILKDATKKNINELTPKELYSLIGPYENLIDFIKNLDVSKYCTNFSNWTGLFAFNDKRAENVLSMAEGARDDLFRIGLYNALNRIFHNGKFSPDERLQINSSYRSYYDQLEEYQKAPGKAANPNKGISRHQLGIAVDMNSFSLPEYIYRAFNFGHREGVNYTDKFGNTLPETWHMEHIPALALLDKRTANDNGMASARRWLKPTTIPIGPKFEYMASGGFIDVDGIGNYSNVIAGEAGPEAVIQMDESGIKFIIDSIEEASRNIYISNANTYESFMDNEFLPAYRNMIDTLKRGERYVG